MPDPGHFPGAGTTQPRTSASVRAKAARYGLNAGDVNTVVEAAMGEAVATTVARGRAPVQCHSCTAGTEMPRATIDKISMIKVRVCSTPSGNNAYIPLGELATISLDTGASYIFHEKNERFIPVKFSVSRVRSGRRGGRENAGPHRSRMWAADLSSDLEWSRRIRGTAAVAQKRLAIVVPVAHSCWSVVLYARCSRPAAWQPAGIVGHSVRGLPGSIRAC